MHKFLIWALLGMITVSCSLNRINKLENIPYMEEWFLGEMPEKQLNVFASRKKGKAKPVLLFIHGGSWRSGNKDIYGFFGRRMARRGVVTVIMDYPLSPEYKVHAMAKASAKAVNWITENVCSGACPGFCRK
ncbi:MAG: alpha/beta hydrolase [Cyclobacteriaceae bacterium]